MKCYFELSGNGQEPEVVVVRNISYLYCYLDAQLILNRLGYTDCKLLTAVEG